MNLKFQIQGLFLRHRCPAPRVPPRHALNVVGPSFIRAMLAASRPRSAMATPCATCRRPARWPSASFNCSRTGPEDSLPCPSRCAIAPSLYLAITTASCRRAITPTAALLSYPRAPARAARHLLHPLSLPCKNQASFRLLSPTSSRWRRTKPRRASARTWPPTTSHLHPNHHHQSLPRDSLMLTGPFPDPLRL